MPTSDLDATLQSVSPVGESEDLFENAPCGYLTMQPDGHIIKANALLTVWTGYTAQQLALKRFQDLLTIGTRLLYETNFAPQFSLADACEEMSLDLRTATGETRAVSASGRVRRAADGQPLMIRVTLFKASERRRYERQLVDARTQIQEQERIAQELLAAERETSKLREQFIAVLGHDLRNPLAAISGGLTLLRREYPAERRNEILHMLDASVVRMATLIDNVLDLARGRLGDGIPLALLPEVLLAPILEHVVAELRLGVMDRVIETDIALPEPINCDPSRIGQLVSNLLGNALTHGAATTPVHIHADAEDGELTIWVANTGDPIPAAAVERLFQPFFRGEVRASQQGLGLGLHIASEIAKAHGGTLVAVSSAEETRFTFRMPLAAANSAGP